MLGTLFILSGVDNLKTKQTLTIEYFKLKYGAKMSWLTGSGVTEHRKGLFSRKGNFSRKGVVYVIFMIFVMDMVYFNDYDIYDVI